MNDQTGGIQSDRIEAFNLEVQTVMYGVLRSTPMGLMQKDNYSQREVVEIICKIDKAITETAKKHGLKEYESEVIENNIGKVWNQLPEVK